MKQSNELQRNSNTQTNLHKVYFQTADHSQIERPIISQHSFTNNTLDVISSKKKKSIILHKRKIASYIIDDQNYDQKLTSQNQIALYHNNITKSLQQNFKASSILNNISSLKQFFDQQVQFRLLYRASDHNFCVNKFHQICDLQSHTLVLCKTKNNQIIGGYTPLMWFQDYQDNNTFYKTDKKNQTFLFSFNKKQKFILAKANRNKAVCCFNKLGPTFGGGYDLSIGDHADVNNSSTSYFPRSFQSIKKDINHKYLTGSKSNQFKLNQWQVFKVFIRQKKVKFQSRILNQQKKTQPKEGFFSQIGKKIIQLFTRNKNKENIQLKQRCEIDS